MRVVAGVACALVAPALAALPAGAAFEVRDSSPAALGAASMDLLAEPMFDDKPAQWRFSASHASLYSVEGLTVEQAAAALALRPVQIEIAYAQLGFPGARERTACLRVTERSDRPIALVFSIERLSFAVEGFEALGGWTAGGGVAAHIPLAGSLLEVDLSGDRLAVSDPLRGLAVKPSLPFTIRLHVGEAWAAWEDRWETDGRRSPRLVLNLPLGELARVRLAHGQEPGRTGAALALRWRLLEVSVGRQDDSAGGLVSSFALALRPPAAKAPLAAGSLNP